MKSMPLRLTLVACLALTVGGIAEGSLTGIETNAPIEYDANSTNALNYAMQTPGREGQVAPFVLFDSATTNSVTLNFNNAAPGLAFFEYRIDGVSRTPDSTHPVVTGDDIYPGVALSSGTTSFLQTFSANSMVEVRLALGGERDFDFDWTAFSVQPIPEPGSLVVWSLICTGIAIAGKRHLRRV